jgi:hypothetical protein
MIFTVGQLRESLKDLADWAEVYVWDDGDRHVIESVDKLHVGHVDLNICHVDLNARSNSTDEINRLREELHELRITMGFIRKLSEDA